MSDSSTAADSQAEMMLVLHMIPGIQFPITRIEHTPTTVRITEVHGANFSLKFGYRMFGNILSEVTGVVDGQPINYKVAITISGCIKSLIKQI